MELGIVAASQAAHHAQSNGLRWPKYLPREMNGARPPIASHCRGPALRRVRLGFTPVAGSRTALAGRRALSVVYMASPVEKPQPPPTLIQLEYAAPERPCPGRLSFVAGLICTAVGIPLCGVGFIGVVISVPFGVLLVAISLLVGGVGVLLCWAGSSLNRRSLPRPYDQPLLRAPSASRGTLSLAGTFSGAVVNLGASFVLRRRAHAQHVIQLFHSPAVPV